MGDSVVTHAASGSRRGWLDGGGGGHGGGEEENVFIADEDAMMGVDNVMGVDAYVDETIFSVQRMAAGLEQGPDAEREVIVFEMQHLIDHCHEAMVDTMLPVICDHVHNWPNHVQMQVAESLLQLVVGPPLPQKEAWMVTCATYRVIHKTEPSLPPDSRDAFMDVWSGVLCDAITHLDLRVSPSSSSRSANSSTAAPPPPPPANPHLAHTNSHSRSSSSASTSASPSPNAQYQQKMDQLCAQRLGVLLSWVSAWCRQRSEPLRKLAARLVGSLAQRVSVGVTQVQLTPLLSTMLTDPNEDVVAFAVESASFVAANIPLSATERQFWPHISPLVTGSNSRLSSAALRTVAYICEKNRAAAGGLAHISHATAAQSGVNNSNNNSSSSGGGGGNNINRRSSGRLGEASPLSLSSSLSASRTDGGYAVGVGSSAGLSSAELASLKEDEERFARQYVAAVFLKLCDRAKAMAALDQREVDDDAYLVLEVIAEVFGELLYTVSQHVQVGFRKQAAKAYIGMSTCNGPLIRRNCAFNLPGVTLAFGGKFANELCTLLDSFSRDADEETRWITSIGLHQSIGVLATYTSKQDKLYSSVHALLNDESPQVRMNVVEHLSDTLRGIAMSPSERGAGSSVNSFGSGDASGGVLAPKRCVALVAVLESIAAPDTDWRMQEELASQLRELVAAGVVPLAPVTDSIIPLLLRMVRSPTAPVRHAAVAAVVHIIRSLPEAKLRKSASASLCAATIRARAGDFHLRVTYVHAARVALELYSITSFSALFLEPVLELFHDPVSNVRLAAVALFSRAVAYYRNNRLAQAASAVLASERDRDVASAAARLLHYINKSEGQAPPRALLERDQVRMEQEATLWGGLPPTGGSGRLDAGSSLTSLDSGGGADATSARSGSSGRRGKLWPFKKAQQPSALGDSVLSGVSNNSDSPGENSPAFHPDDEEIFSKLGVRRPGATKQSAPGGAAQQQSSQTQTQQQPQQQSVSMKAATAAAKREALQSVTAAAASSSNSNGRRSANQSSGSAQSAQERTLLEKQNQAMAASAPSQSAAWNAAAANKAPITTATAASTGKLSSSASSGKLPVTAPAAAPAGGDGFSLSRQQALTAEYEKRKKSKSDEARRKPQQSAVVEANTAVNRAVTRQHTAPSGGGGGGTAMVEKPASSQVIRPPQWRPTANDAKQSSSLAKVKPGYESSSAAMKAGKASQNAQPQARPPQVSSSQQTTTASSGSTTSSSKTPAAASSAAHASNAGSSGSSSSSTKAPNKTAAASSAGNTTTTTASKSSAANAAAGSRTVAASTGAPQGMPDLNATASGQNQPQRSGPPTIRPPVMTGAAASSSAQSAGARPKVQSTTASATTTLQHQQQPSLVKRTSGGRVGGGAAVLQSQQQSQAQAQQAAAAAQAQQTLSSTGALMLAAYNKSSSTQSSSSSASTATKAAARKAVLSPRGASSSSSSFAPQQTQSAGQTTMRPATAAALNASGDLDDDAVVMPQRTLMAVYRSDSDDAKRVLNRQKSMHSRNSTLHRSTSFTKQHARGGVSPVIPAGGRGPLPPEARLPRGMAPEARMPHSPHSATSAGGSGSNSPTVRPPIIRPPANSSPPSGGPPVSGRIGPPLSGGGSSGPVTGRLPKTGPRAPPLTVSSGARSGSDRKQ